VRGSDGPTTSADERPRGGRGAHTLFWGDDVQRERKGVRGTVALVLKGVGCR
jgi:hypothetical protein